MTNTTRSLRIDAPAKLNLFLRILRKRPDKYHDLYSLFHKIRLTDQLTFYKTNTDTCKITCSKRNFPLGDTNLISQAFCALKKRRGFEGGVRVVVKKRIPMKAGLGGGSSDAAATLIATNRLYRLGLSGRELGKIGSSLGADVPFFLNPTRSALVSGIGDRVKPFPAVTSFNFLLIFFPKGLVTKSVYEALFLTPTRSGVRISQVSQPVRTLEQLGSIVKNDLMPASFKLYPLVRKVYQTILRKNYIVSQTGSGPTLFVPDQSRYRLRKLASDLRNRFGLTSVITQSLSR